MNKSNIYIKSNNSFIKIIRKIEKNAKSENKKRNILFKIKFETQVKNNLIKNIPVFKKLIKIKNANILNVI